MRRAVAERWATRIWERDTSLWTTDARVAATIANRLGWLDAPMHFQEQIEELYGFATGIREAGFTQAVVCGMGGSSLAPEVLATSLRALGARPARPRARFDRPGRRRRRRGPGAERSEPLPDRHQVRHDHRDARLPGLLLGARVRAGRPHPRSPSAATASWPSPTRATASRRSRTRTCSARSSSTRPTSAAATAP